MAHRSPGPWGAEWAKGGRAAGAGRGHRRAVRSDGRPAPEAAAGTGAAPLTCGPPRQTAPAGNRPPGAGSPPRRPPSPPRRYTSAPPGGLRAASGDKPPRCARRPQRRLSGGSRPCAAGPRRGRGRQRKKTRKRQKSGFPTRPDSSSWSPADVAARAGETVVSAVRLSRAQAWAACFARCQHEGDFSARARAKSWSFRVFVEL